MHTRTDIVEEPLSEARLRELVAVLPFFTVMLDREHRYVWVNRLDDTLDISQVIGKTLETHVHASSRLEVYQHVERAFETQQVVDYETRGYGSGEMETWWAVRVVPLPRDELGRQRVLLLSGDITQRRKAEDALRESEARFRMLTEASPDFVVVLDHERRCEYVNREPSAAGIQRATMLGRHIDEFVRAEDRELVNQSIQLVLDTGTTTRFDMLGAYTGRPYTCRVLPLPPVDDKPRVLLVTTDMSEQRAAELHRRTLEQRLSQAQKMESIGQLAGGLAHDFNNMIMVMGLHLEAAREFQNSGRVEQARHELDEVESAAKRSADLTRQLLAFARRQPHQPQPVRAAELTSSAVRFLSRLIPESIQLELNILAPESWMMADAGLIEQVIMNLCVNARDAIGTQGGMIRVEVGRCSIPPCTVASAVPAGDYVTLTVSDTGAGIPEADLPRIFEPFFTTKPTGQGTGLGLAMVHGIVTQHQGYVTAESTRGEGSVLTAYLPEVPAARPSQSPLASPPPQPARGRILIAEDEPRMRRLLARLLRRAGHAVIEADNGMHALSVVEASDHPFDVIVLDAVMPEMNGKECYERIQQLQPGLPAIFSSGYAGDMLPSTFLRDRGVRMIAKPYDSRTLLDAIDEILQQRATAPAPANTQP